MPEPTPGIDAWRAGSYADALGLAQAAAAQDPEDRRARLMIGYALLRTGQQAAGLAVLRALAASEPRSGEEREIQWRARAVSQRLDARGRRNQWSISAGSGLVVDRLAYVPAAQGVVVGALQGPVVAPLALRTEVSYAFGRGFGDLGIVGPRVALLAVGYHILGDGPLSVAADAGPTVWFASSGYWPEGESVLVGAQLDVGADVRFSRVVGLRLAQTVDYWPGMARLLPDWTWTTRTELGVEFWFGGGGRR